MSNINWKNTTVTPPTNRVLIVHCPDWCDTGYQVCKWNGKAFYYDDQPNDMFHVEVVSWSMFLEAD